MPKTVHMERDEMYERYANQVNQLLLPSDFFLLFGDRLNSENRWANLAQHVPLAKVDEK